MSTAFRIVMDSAQEVGTGSTSTATGRGTVVFDSVNNTLTYSITITGLDFGELLEGGVPETADPNDDVTMMHIHNGARGMNGAVAFDLLPLAASDDADDFAFVQNLDGSWTFTGIWETTDPASIALDNFLAQLGAATPGNDVSLYFNTHTAAFGGGAIRGQFVCISDDNDNSVTGTASDDWLPGLGGADTLNGGIGNDRLEGGDGNDIMIGGDGVDTMSGGAGDDTYQIDNAADAISEAGGSGTDTVQSTLTHTLGADFENLLLLGVNAINGIGNAGANFISGNQFDNTLSGLGGNDTFDANDGADTVLGGDGDDLANGAEGNDTLDGGANNDVLVGGLGMDSLLGRAGDDQLFGDADADNAQGGDGVDFIDGGAANDTIAGGLGADTLNGGEGDDTIQYTFGDGIDSTDGGNGTDTLSIAGTAFGQTLDVIWNGSVFTSFKGGALTSIESANAALGLGTDTLRYVGSTAAVSVNLAAGTATGFTSISGIEYVYGAGFDDTIVGDGFDNRLEGEAGADIISAAGGADVITGGLGADTISAGDGADIVRWAFGDGTDATDGGGGTDVLAIFGTSAGQTLDMVWNGTAFTSFRGGTLTGLEQVRADLTEGVDTLTYVGSSAAVSVNLATSTATGFTDIFNVENATGAEFNDTLTGNSGANVLIGNGGDDVLTGFAGMDTLNGGAGNDTMVGGNDADTFVFTAGSGADTINAFDANPLDGQDILRITGYGVTAATFASRVTITDLGNDTLVTIDGVSTILLTGVNGNGANVITQDDFLLAG